MALMMDVVDKIMASKYDKATKITRLWCVVQLNYRQELGDKAWGAMGKLTDQETVSAMAFISGLAMGLGSIAKDDEANHKRFIERLKELVPELTEK